jgi:hypothetical protein
VGSYRRIFICLPCIHLIFIFILWVFYLYPYIRLDQVYIYTWLFYLIDRNLYYNLYFLYASRGLYSGFIHAGGILSLFLLIFYIREAWSLFRILLRQGIALGGATPHGFISVYFYLHFNHITGFFSYSSMYITFLYLLTIINYIWFNRMVGYFIWRGLLLYWTLQFNISSRIYLFSYIVMF